MAKRSVARKSARQLDAEIAAALAKSPQRRATAPAAPARAEKMPRAENTLRRIAQIAFPGHKHKKVTLEVADYVDRYVVKMMGGRGYLTDAPGDPSTFYLDYVVQLNGFRADKVMSIPDPLQGGNLLDRMRAQELHEVLGMKRTPVPVGSAYVSKFVTPPSQTGDVTVTLPPIDPATMDVAVDAILAADGVTPTVLDMVGNALWDQRVGTTKLMRDAYVALAELRAKELRAGERASRTERRA